MAYSSKELAELGIQQWIIEARKQRRKSKITQDEMAKVIGVSTRILREAEIKPWPRYEGASRKRLKEYFQRQGSEVK